MVRKQIRENKVNQQQVKMFLHLCQIHFLQDNIHKLKEGKHRWIIWQWREMKSYKIFKINFLLINLIVFFSIIKINSRKIPDIISSRKQDIYPFSF